MMMIMMAVAEVVEGGREMKECKGGFPLVIQERKTEWPNVFLRFSPPQQARHCVSTNINTGTMYALAVLNVIQQLHHFCRGTT